MNKVLLLLVCASLGVSDASRCDALVDADYLPVGVSWMLAQLVSAARKGNQVQPLGFRLMLGVTPQWRRDALFLDELFGTNASQGFLKQAIWLKQGDASDELKAALRFPDNSAGDVLVAFWHADDGDWLTRWTEQLLASNVSNSRVMQGYEQGSFTLYADGRACFREVHPSGVTLSSFERQLLGSGSHRQLQSTIRLSGLQAEKNHCRLLMIEHLPNSVFADAFELQRLSRRGAFEQLHLYGDLDLERPAFFSHQSMVELQANLSSDGTTFVSLPLHARYPPLSADTPSHSLVNLSYYPNMFISCQPELMLKPVIRGDAVEQRREERIEWRVPAGRIQHAAFVPACTALAVAMATLVLASLAVWPRPKASKLKE